MKIEDSRPPPRARRRTRWLVAAVVVLLLVGGGAIALVWTGPRPEPRSEAEVERDEKEVTEVRSVDELAPLLPFLERGPLSQVEEKKGCGPRTMSVIALVRARPEEVWKTLTDYESYHEFIPKLVESKILSRESKGVRVRFEIDAPVRNFAYTQLHVEDPGRRIILVRSESGDVDGVFHWSIQPVKDGAETIVVHRGAARLAASSWVVRWVIEKEPELEEMLSLSTMTILVRGIRDRTEARVGRQE